MSRNDNVKQPEAAQVSQSLDELLKSFKPETTQGLLFSSSTNKSAYPSFETGYFGSGFKQNLPTTTQIIQYFKDLSATSPRPEPAYDEKKLNNSHSLKELYFPSKKGVDSACLEQKREQSSSICRPVMPSSRVINVLPVKDLSRLDSSNLLQNLDAALADIARSTEKADYYSISTVPLLMMDSKSLEIKSTSPQSNSLSSNFSASGKLPKKSVGDQKTERIETNNKFSSLRSNKRSICTTNCDDQPKTFSYSIECVGENPSMIISPLLKKHGERNKYIDSLSSDVGTQSKGRYDSHFADGGNLVPMAQHPSLSSEITLFPYGTSETACRTKSTEKFGTQKTVVSNAASSSLPTKRSQTSKLNPLLSSEKLGRWMEGLATSSNITYRGIQEDRKSHDFEITSSSQGENNTATDKMETWWRSEDQIPSYLPAKALGNLLPDYGTIWTQTDNYSDPSKKTPHVTSSTTTSDFCCNPTISLASRISSITNFSCSPMISLTPSTR